MVNSFSDVLTAWSWVAQVFGCRKKMSAIAILDFGGANELFHQMSALAKKGRVDYMLYYNEDESNALPEMDPMVCPPPPPCSSCTHTAPLMCSSEELL